MASLFCILPACVKTHHRSLFITTPSTHLPPSNPRVLGKSLNPTPYCPVSIVDSWTRNYSLPRPYAAVTLALQHAPGAVFGRASLFVCSSTLRALLVRSLLDRQQRGVLRLQNTTSECFIARSLFTLDVGSLVAFFSIVFCALLDPRTTIMTLLPWHSHD